jgi:hypothetical protein
MGGESTGGESTRSLGVPSGAAEVSPCGDCTQTNRDLGLPFNIDERVELVAPMVDDPDPIPVGTCGSVRRVRKFLHEGSPWYQIEIDWDIQRSLAVVMPPDKIVSLQRPRERRAQLRKWNLEK